MYKVERHTNVFFFPTSHKRLSALPRVINLMAAINYLYAAQICILKQQQHQLQHIYNNKRGD